MKDLREIQNDRMQKIREATRTEVKAVTGIDPDVIDWYDPTFSAEKLREHCYRSRKARLGGHTLREASAESSFGQLLRAGVNNFMFDAYQTVPTIYQDLVRVASSNKYEELYAPLYNSELPQEVFPSEPFDDSRILGLDVHVRNRKFGRVLAFERELVDEAPVDVSPLTAALVEGHLSHGLVHAPSTPCRSQPRRYASAGWSWILRCSASQMSSVFDASSEPP